MLTVACTAESSGDLLAKMSAESEIVPVFSAAAMLVDAAALVIAVVGAAVFVVKTAGAVTSEGAVIAAGVPETPPVVIATAAPVADVATIVLASVSAAAAKSAVVVAEFNVLVGAAAPTMPVFAVVPARPLSIGLATTESSARGNDGLFGDSVLALMIGVSFVAAAVTLPGSVVGSSCKGCLVASGSNPWSAPDTDGNSPNCPAALNVRGASAGTPNVTITLGVKGGEGACRADWGGRSTAGKVLAVTKLGTAWIALSMKEFFHQDW